MSDNASQRHIVQQLSDALYEKTAGLSSVNTMTRFDEFEQLFKLGDETVRYILDRMRAGEIRIFWFPLLKRISEADPVPAEERGMVDKMRQRWVTWGEASGLLD